MSTELNVKDVTGLDPNGNQCLSTGFITVHRHLELVDSVPTYHDTQFDARDIQNMIVFTGTAEEVVAYVNEYYNGEDMEKDYVELDAETKQELEEELIAREKLYSFFKEARKRQQQK
ncbi:hypothetical protein N781_14400 [Pontibacillus halophilus JSM 076056 = DSM 19796]|uniref:Uncharacterized protein n=1 Tax=Pontibacillus halophilus JSM 076056 = DSM 19796 TaxID=1385510 RepID=A0A0A5IA98_9BACI|nr:hypothetical protein [Pontibacillus halophilus]KGX92762.1 hypothetical protein N781_14400 [Pontibacillus halophilus JSM 076056 = DSM 19796]